MRPSHLRIGHHRLIRGIFCMLTGFDHRGEPIYKSPKGGRVRLEQKKKRKPRARQRSIRKIGDRVIINQPLRLIGVIHQLEPLRVRVTTKGVFEGAILKSPVIRRRRKANARS